MVVIVVVGQNIHIIDVIEVKIYTVEN